jgi:hypothetical protein
MSFIRVKNIKKKSGNSYEYAYLVENKWMKRGGKGSRQKVKAFLGRVHKPVLVENKDFLEHHSIEDIDSYVKENSLSKVAQDLISWEFVKHGVSNEFIVDFEGKVVRKYNNKAVLKMNEGFLCDHTLKKLVGFRFKEDEEHAGMALAKAFVEAGINIPQELFVKVFEKVS